MRRSTTMTRQPRSAHRPLPTPTCPGARPSRWRGRDDHLLRQGEQADRRRLRPGQLGDHERHLGNCPTGTTDRHALLICRCPSMWSPRPRRPAGGDVTSGDVISYKITVENTSKLAFEISVSDDLTGSSTTPTTTAMPPPTSAMSPTPRPSSTGKHRPVGGWPPSPTRSRSRLRCTGQVARQRGARHHAERQLPARHAGDARPAAHHASRTEDVIAPEITDPRCRSPSRDPPLPPPAWGRCAGHGRSRIRSLLLRVRVALRGPSPPIAKVAGAHSLRPGRLRPGRPDLALVHHGMLN